MDAELGKVAIQALVGALVVQLLATIIFFLGFIPRVKRVLDIEIPARFKEVTTSLGRLHEDMSDFRREFSTYRERMADRLANHEARLDGLEGRNGLDDTHNRRRPSNT